MDKMEYKALIAELQNLVKTKKYKDVIAVADGINWNKVNNINDLISGSDAYEAAGANEQARDLLLLAHERSPIGRMILYKLSMISIKIGDLEEAQEYYNEFVQIAPHDSLKFILKYNLSVAKGADNASLIKVLEQLKDADFIEEWAYELAYLYHKTSQADKCIELCNEIILWFGDGPVVERALELKMLYQPLDKNQEDKYRSLQQKKDGITEIKANEPLLSGEIVPRTITIPSVELPPERFNTVNLQAEIKKNIDEIMKATEKGVVNENIDAIKMLVEEIPYLQVQEEKIENEERFSVNETFNNILEEGYDGQISLRLPDESKETESQIEGQMTIQDVMAEWERTKRAAEAAMEQAKAKELEYARAKALKEANTVLTRLEGAMSKIDAGMTSAELLKEEYLGNASSDRELPVIDKVEIDNVEDESSDKPTFLIPKFDEEGEKVGTVDIPIVRPSAAVIPVSSGVVEGIVTAAESIGGTQSWEPPTFDETKESEDVDYKEASQLIADVNKMLQQEIDRLSGDESVDENIGNEEQVEQSEAVSSEPNFEFTINLPDLSEEKKGTPTDEKVFEEEEPKIDDIELPIITMPEDLFQEEPKVEKITLDEEPVVKVDTSLPPIPEVSLEPDELAQLVNENVLTNIIRDEVPALSEEDLAPFSYFLPLRGMKNSITQVLAGAIHHLENPSSNGGNILVVGDRGAGKTQMAMDIISALQNKTGKPAGGIGKISGENLNTKDIQKLFAKIQGGCLIVEGAGAISKETAVTFSLLMEQDTTGTIIILEDTIKGIDRVLRLDGSFTRRFTEKIVIPTFTIDELVVFGKTYAEENGYTIDEMGILALYNRINAISRYDHATTIQEVSEIIDEAINRSSKGGFFNKAKIDRNGYVILRERDFEN